MKNLSPLLLGFVLTVFAFPPFTRAEEELPSPEVQDMEWAIIPHKEAKDKAFVNDMKYGSGTRTLTEVKFEVKVSAIRGQTVNDVQVFIFPLERDMEWKNNDVNKGHEISTVLKLKSFSLTPTQQDWTDTSTAARFETMRSQNANMAWQGGREFCGYVAELRIGGKVVAVKTSGSDVQQIRKAFFIFRSSKNYPKPSAKTDTKPE